MRYPSLELGQVGRDPCPDVYEELSTLICPGAKKLILQVAANAVYLQCGLMPQGLGTGPGAVVWQDEEPYMAGVAAVLNRDVAAVRVRNWKPGAKAEVFLSVA